jgi:hypothetical protein
MGANKCGAPRQIFGIPSFARADLRYIIATCGSSGVVRARVDVVGEEAIPNEVRQFLVDHVDSVMQLELMLLLQSEPGRQWSGPDIAAELRVDTTWVAAQLDDLCRRQVLICHGGPTARYQFGPADPAVAQTVRMLASRYATHRVSIISMIFSKPADRLRNFADAFRLRKDKSDG